MPTLPEALLLLALDPRKGLVHSGAFLAIDHGLRAAALAELRSRGVVRTRGGEIARTDRPLAGTGSRTLDTVATALPDRGTVDERLDDLRVALPAIRDGLTVELREAGVLRGTAFSPTPNVLPGITAYELVDAALVPGLHAQLAAAVRTGEAISPRDGTLVALVVACNLDRIVFPGHIRADARKIADFVAQKDSLVKAARAAIQRAEGNE